MEQKLTDTRKKHQHFAFASAILKETYAAESRNVEKFIIDGLLLHQRSSKS